MDNLSDNRNTNATDEDEDFKRLVEKFEALERDIAIAFANTQYPGDEAVAETYNSTGRGWEFLGARWQETPSEIGAMDDSLLYFRADVCRYYLPAFMIASLNYHLMEFIAPFFVPPVSPRSYWTWERFTDRFSGMTEEQYECILRYVECIVEDFDNMFDDVETTEAVLTFWRKPYFLTE